ncbi:MAG TPA: hypothetical protein VG916_03605, partial [Gemmatimonadaceae bacterium]|nr:hypothetical protein [Gemmatimonadaceae bacterium]
MRRLSDHPTALRRILLAGSALALSVLSCGREPTAPGGNGDVVRSQALAFITEFPSGLPVFEAAGGSGVAFTKVHVFLTNPDGSVALDKFIDFPADKTDLTVTLDVLLPANSPTSGVPLTLNLDYVNADGVTVFHGGPATVTAVPKTADGPPPPSPVTIPIAYTGPGADAKRVRITPGALSVKTGAPFSFTADALDASGNVVPNTPIVFSVQGTGATINAATGQGTAGATRAVVQVTAALLTGPTDAATLTIVSPPATIAAASGDNGENQTANVNGTLAKPVIVKVTASDGGPAGGVTVTFAAHDGGAPGAATAVTSAEDGTAQTTWKLGPGAGPQTMTVTADGVTGSVVFHATAKALDPVKMVVATAPPAAVAAGSAFGLTVNAVDADNDVATGFTGDVTAALGSGAPTGASLTGTTTVHATNGVATFTDLRINLPGTYTLSLSTPTLPTIATPSLTVTAGAPAKLVFHDYPSTAVAGTYIDPFTVTVEDALGNVVTSFHDRITMSSNGPTAAALAAASAPARRDAASLAPAASVRAASPATVNTRRAGTAPTAGTTPAEALDGTTSVNAENGVATFNLLKLTAAGSYTLTASATGVTSATGGDLVITPAAAASVEIVSGDGQLGPGGVAFPSPVVVRVVDAFENAVPGVSVSFTPVGGGTANPSSATTNGSGTAQTLWTAIGAAGPKQLSVAATGVSLPLIVKGTTTTASGTPRTWTGATD